MSIIKSGTTTTTAYSVDANTDGDLVFIVSESLTAMSITAAGAVSLPTSSLTITSGATLNGGVVVNEDGADVDFRVEGDTDANLLFVDASTDRVGVGTSGPQAKFHIRPENSDTPASALWLEQYNAAGTDRSVLVAQVDAANNKTIFNSSGTNTGSYEFQCGNINTLFVGSGGALVLKGGDTAANGTGITFPATQSASSDANTLDDYEEGTWTPTITGTSTAPVYTTSIASGNYTKIGRMVYVEFLILITGVTSQGTGNINITGLPFSSSSGIYQSNISFTYNDTWDVNVRNGYTVGTIIQPVPNAVTQTNLGWAAATLSTGYFSGSGWYIA